MSIKELVAKIKSGEVKSYDVVKSYVDTINKKEDKIDAFLLLKTDEALQKAKEIDEKVAKGEKLGQACCRLKFSSQVEKVPFCTVMLARLRDRMWSTQPSKKWRS